MAGWMVHLRITDGFVADTAVTLYELYDMIWGVRNGRYHPSNVQPWKS